MPHFPSYPKTYRRSLTEEEERLWRAVTSDDTPLPPAARGVAPDRIEKPAPRIQRQPHTPLPVFADKPYAPLTRGAYAGIDRATAEKFRRGHYPIDASLDLHGMSRERAHQTLSAFLVSHYDLGSRCLLVITGKGGKSMTEEGRGLLRELVPHWLDEPRLRPLVLAFDTAQLRHGGSGAYYILLRRKRHG